MHTRDWFFCELSTEAQRSPEKGRPKSHSSFLPDILNSLPLATNTKKKPTQQVQDKLPTETLTGFELCYAFRYEPLWKKLHELYSDLPVRLANQPYKD